MESRRSTIERIYLTRADLEQEENTARYWRHIERYISVRHRAYGNVLDLACGVGYGSYILSKNPDVEHVYGVDQSLDTIEFAKSEYGGDKVSFFSDIEEVDKSLLEDGIDRFDVLVSIETIEHIAEDNILPQIARRFHIPKLLISFPHIKSTHFNKYHFHDFNTQQIKDLFKEWLLTDEYKIHHDVTILEFTANPEYWNLSLKDS